jgi:eukaryotic-like serine/threonine-protein kinase
VGVAREYESSARTVVERRDPLLGAMFDQRFRVDAKIAAGGFGAIYRATHVDSHREFALKLLHPNLTNDPRVIARFRREGAALLLLRDPHTVKAYDLGEASDGTLYIVMELLRGESLFERYRARGALPWHRMLTIARAVCSSLTEAHSLGIIHRDLKPTNIHLEPAGDNDHVKVLDFGIARILQGSNIDNAELTTAGQMIGTLDYMSPEQMVGGECTATSDIYTLGVVMYEMIAGRRPYDDTNSAAAALAALLTTTPVRLSSRAPVTADVERIVMRCIESQHSDRYQSAQALAAALDEVLEGDEAVTLMARAAGSGARPIARVPPAAPGFSYLTTLQGPPPAVVVPAAPAAPEVTSPASPAAFAARAASATFSAREARTPFTALEVTPPFVAPEAPAAPEVPAVAAPPAAQPAATGAAAAGSRTVPAIGPTPPTRGSPTGRQAPVTPPSGMSIPTKNLRESYPMIHRPAPSPMRPPTPTLEDRQFTPPSGTHFGRRGRHRVATWIALLATGIAIAVAAALAAANGL